MVSWHLADLLCSHADIGDETQSATELFWYNISWLVTMVVWTSRLHSLEQLRKRLKTAVQPVPYYAPLTAINILILSATQTSLNCFSDSHHHCQIPQSQSLLTDEVGSLSTTSRARQS